MPTKVFNDNKIDKVVKHITTKRTNLNFITLQQIN